MINDKELEELKEILRHLNPQAEQVISEHGKVPLNKVINTGRFDMEAAQRSPGWIRELLGEHTPESDEYGIASFVWRARRPLSSERF